MRTAHQASTAFTRDRLVMVAIVGLVITITARLFYWQVIKGYSSEKTIQQQVQREITQVGERGNIYTADNHLLVGNREVYRLVVESEKLKLKPAELTAMLLPPLSAAQGIQDKPEEVEKLKLYLLEKISGGGRWIVLQSRITNDLKDQLAALEISGLTFDPYISRYYPEASLAAHLTGFVGKADNGEDVGYFGIEGALNKELSGQEEKQVVNTDAFGYLLAGQKITTQNPMNGRDVVLTIRRDLQYLSETMLDEGIERYGAEAGEVIIMEPKTGKILALATWPHYAQENYYEFDTELYKNPSLALAYEPGSTFKTLTVAAGIDAGVISPDTTCPVCAEPRKIAGYTIKTWNNEYHPNITINEALAKSDNTAMIYITDLLGKDRFVNYLKDFGIGEPLHLDLQDDTSPPFPDRWGPVELATTSFGQGISTNSMQMMRAVGAIANQGKMMQPQILEKVIDHQTGVEIEVEPEVVRQVISPESATTVTDMMVNSAHHGEAQWIVSKHYTTAAKTGTSQVATKGGYEADKTIASFIGFAPPKDPQFIMLVKLTNPTSSPWAAETAAPLWYKIAEKVFLALNIPPDK